MNNLVIVKGIKKSYGSHVILEDINLEINKGDSIVLTGHNGTGKSTILKMIGNLENYEKGKIQYAPNIQMRYVPEHFPKLRATAFKYIHNMAQILGMNQDEAKKRSEQLFEQFYMTSLMDTPIRYLSKGSQQKVAVIQALLTRSDLLLLDEPLSGQDSDSQEQFIKTVKELNREGTAILMSCHEKWLMNAISKDVYEIVNKTLVKKSEISSNGYEYSVMTFEKGEALNLDAETDSITLQELLLKTEQRGRMTVVYTKKEDSRTVLLKMMQSGYELRRMCDETVE